MQKAVRKENRQAKSCGLLLWIEKAKLGRLERKKV